MVLAIKKIVKQFGSEYSVPSPIPFTFSIIRFKIFQLVLRQAAGPWKPVAKHN